MIEQLRKRLLDREHPVRIHLIGVAGAGMSGLARMLLEMGHHVSGCDRVTSEETERLQKMGLAFSCPHNPDAVRDAEIVIYSSAIREDNVALAAARKNGCLCLRRAECLAAILNSKKGVVVAGTHGKTTTSSLTAHLLREGRLRPCHYVGAEIPVLGANAHWNEDSEYLVAEGDESDGTLVNYIPEHSIILNIEAEHLDFYRDLDHIKSVFARLCQQTRGKIFYCKNDPGANDVCSKYPNSVSYGWQDADYTATELTEKRGLIPQIEPRYHYPYFSHIFDGGYSAGYYFYTWAAVLDKDVFEAFRESGDLFNKRIADDFRRKVLARGGSADGMTLYRDFRGKDPDKRPMLRARGLWNGPDPVDTLAVMPAPAGATPVESVPVK